MSKTYFFNVTRRDNSLREISSESLITIRAKAYAYLSKHNEDWLLIRVRQNGERAEDFAEVRKYGERIFYDTYGDSGIYGELYPKGNLRSKVWADG